MYWFCSNASCLARPNKMNVTYFNLDSFHVSETNGVQILCEQDKQSFYVGVALFEIGSNHFLFLLFYADFQLLMVFRR